MKKLLSTLLFCVMVTANLCLSGCSCFNDPLVTRFTVYYSEDETVKYECGNKGKLSVPYHPTGYYYCEYVVFHKRSGKVVKYHKLDYQRLSANKIGKTYHFSQFSTLNGRMQDFMIEVTVEDTRIRPTIVLDPNGAIEYVENERYVYKYDGKMHIPHLLHCEYNTEKIEINGGEVRDHGKTPREVGVYNVHIYVRPDDYVDEFYKLNYGPAILDIIVEIVE